MLYLSNRKDHFTQMVHHLEFKSGGLPFRERLFHTNAAIETLKVDCVRLRSRYLLIDRKTGSWCICDKREVDSFFALDRKTIRKITGTVSSKVGTDWLGLIERLYCRGLVKVNGKALFDTEILKRDDICVRKALFLIIPTTQCNLVCCYCSAAHDSATGVVMDPLTAKKIIDLIMEVPSESPTILFHGGEALLNFELVVWCVDYARKHAEKCQKNFNFRLQTNATLLSKKVARKLRELDIQVGLSFDGGPDLHNQTRVFRNGKGSFGAALKGLRNAQEADLPYGAICVINRQNVDRIHEICQWYSDVGIKYVKMNPIAMLGKAKSGWNNYGISPQEYLRAHTSYLDYIHTHDEFPIEENLRHMIRNVSSRMSSYMCMRAKCGAGEEFFVFTPDGVVYPCDRFRYKKQYSLGNVHDLKALIGIRRQNESVSSIFERSIETIDTCKKCLYQRFCRGGCTLETFEHFNSPMSPHPWCEYYCNMYKTLFIRIDQSPDFARTLCDEVELHEQEFFN